MTVRKPEPELQPLDLFQEWFAAAAKTGMAMPEAMTLATADEHGRPSARMVLLKGFDPAGRLRFFTNYDSRKAGGARPHPARALPVLVAGALRAGPRRGDGLPPARRRSPTPTSRRARA